MRTMFDFSPLFRSGVGFDRIVDLLETTNHAAMDEGPPYDIVKDGDDAYRLTLAVAGFSPSELTITYAPNSLVVSGQKPGEDDDKYLYRGIAGRAFQRRFELADHVVVAGANLQNGLLRIDLKRELPEAMKPRRIEIAQGTAPFQARQIGTDKQAA